MNAEFFAVIDSGNISGAVYAVADNAARALAEAIAETGSETEQFDVVPCSAAAAALVLERGGAPGVVYVSPYGVDVRD